jgi:hypothetical protein
MESSIPSHIVAKLAEVRQRNHRGDVVWIMPLILPLPIHAAPRRAPTTRLPERP